MKIRQLFESLQGIWTFERRLESLVSGNLLGTVQGSAEFRYQDADKTRLHYQEKGLWWDAQGEGGQKGKGSPIYQEYLYVYQPLNDSLEKHFAEKGDDRGLFYALRFLPPNMRGIPWPLAGRGRRLPTKGPASCATKLEERSCKRGVRGEKILIAQGEHVCGYDQYQARHAYYYREQYLERIALEYQVSGPQKSYGAKTSFIPIAKFLL